MISSNAALSMTILPHNLPHNMLPQANQEESTSSSNQLVNQEERLLSRDQEKSLSNNQSTHNQKFMLILLKIHQLLNKLFLMMSVWWTMEVSPTIELPSETWWLRSSNLRSLRVTESEISSPNSVDWEVELSEPQRFSERWLTTAMNWRERIKFYSTMFLKTAIKIINWSISSKHSWPSNNGGEDKKRELESS